jgi:hypothetical protein
LETVSRMVPVPSQDRGSNLLLRAIGGDRSGEVLVVEIPSHLHCLRAEAKRARDSNCKVILLCESKGWADYVLPEALRLLPNHRVAACSRGDEPPGCKPVQELP